MKAYILEITAFITGAVVMILELTGSRILAPYVGSSLPVWTGLIGILLGSLSIGYYVGGNVADKNPRHQILSLILLFSAVSLGVVPMLSVFFLPMFIVIFNDVRINAIFATLLLFTIPSILLGMVSPYIIRLKMHAVQTSGSTSGNIYAISTIGSIVGTFTAGFFLIAYLGSTQIFYVLACIIALLSFLLFPMKSGKKIFLFIMFISLSFLLQYVEKLKLSYSKNIADIDTLYNHVEIYDSPNWNKKDITRIMKIGNEYSSGMFLQSNELAFEYTKYYRLVDHFYPHVKHALMIGGAGYSYPKDFIRNHPSAHLDVVEIDPKLTELAKKYFHLQQTSQLSMYHEDGRTFLNKNTKSYDVIFNDAFASYYSLPFQLTTKEAIQKMYTALSKNGLVITNIISSVDGEKGKFLQAEYTTYASVFPHVYIFPVTNQTNTVDVQNIMLIAIKNKKNLELTDDNQELNNYLQHHLDTKISGNTIILTDNYAPVEQYAMQYY